MTTKVAALQAHLDLKAALRDAAQEASHLRNQVLVSGALAIKTGASPLARTTASVYAAFADPNVQLNAPFLVLKTAGDMPALVGTVANLTFNTFSFFMNSAGTLSTVMGTPGTSLATLRLAKKPLDAVQLGFVIINPTGTGPFVGGSTALDDATVTPNAVYVNTVGGVVRPGEPIFELTPVDGKVVVEARVRPADRAELHEGVAANVRISAFDSVRHGVMRGRVTEVSADTVPDEKGDRLFRVKVEVDAADSPIPVDRLSAGMTATADLVTGRRTVLEYLVSPLHRFGSRALTEPR